MIGMPHYVMLRVDSRTTDMVSRAESDKIVDDWMKLRIDFDAVAREQYSKKNKDFDQTELYTKVKVPGGKSVRVYSIDALYRKRR